MGIGYFTYVGGVSLIRYRAAHNRPLGYNRMGWIDVVVLGVLVAHTASSTNLESATKTRPTNQSSQSQGGSSRAALIASATALDPIACGTLTFRVRVISRLMLP